MDSYARVAHILLPGTSGVHGVIGILALLLVLAGIMTAALRILFPRADRAGSGHVITGAQRRTRDHSGQRRSLAGRERRAAHERGRPRSRVHRS